MKARLTVVLVQSQFIGEELFTRWTIMMGLFVVIFQFARVVEMFIATLAIMVAKTLNPMFFQPYPGWKVLRASLADIVTRGIGSVTIKSWPRSKRAVAAFAVGHDYQAKVIRVARSLSGWLTCSDDIRVSWLETLKWFQLWRKRLHLRLVTVYIHRAVANLPRHSSQPSKHCFWNN